MSASRFLLLSFLCLAAILALLPNVAWAGTITVDNTTCLLPEAIVAANTDTNGVNCTISPSPTPGGADTLLLAAGQHQLMLGLDASDGLNGASSITSTMTIIGNPAGSSIVRTGIISFRLLHVSDTGNLTLQDVTLSNGNSLFDGGAIYNRGILTLIDSTLSSNTTTLQGGALFAISGTVTISDSFIISNTASNGGGGITNSSATLNISGSTIRSNQAVLDGGGLTNNNGGTATIVATTFISNTSVNGFGGAINNNSGANFNLNNSFVLYNTAFTGGGLMNIFATANVNNTDFIGNNGTESAGGLYNSTGTTNITGSTFEGNSAFGLGGGLYTLNGTINVTDTEVIFNNSTSDGGGFYSNNGTITARSTTVFGNSANRGGGFYMNLSPVTLNLFDSDVISNSATSSGGGIYNVFSLMNIIGTRVLSNTAGAAGGGIFNDNGSATLTNSSILYNRSVADGGGINNTAGISYLDMRGSTVGANRSSAGTGGGIYNGATLIMTGSAILSNTAFSAGGGINNASEAFISNSRIISNSGFPGGGIYQFLVQGGTTILESCIVDNSDIAVHYDGGMPIDAAGNWWGAPDGPAGVGPGSGDSVNSFVNYDNFKTSPIVDCPLRSADVALTKEATAADTASIDNLLPGQPLTFTVTITNFGQRVSHLVLTDPLPTGFQLTEVITGGAPMTQSGDSYYYEELAAGEDASLIFVGTIDATLNAQTTLFNGATLTDGTGNEWFVSVAPLVIPPAVRFSQTSYTADEDQGSANVTLLLSRPNPYAPGNVNLVSTDSAQGASISAILLVTFPPGSSQQIVPVAIADDGVVLPRTIDLELQDPVGLQLGDPSTAQIIINEDEQAGLVVQKTASTARAGIGETILYTYQITNTGDVTLTISANDDQLGNVAGLAGTLAPLATRSATLSYTVQGDDPQGDLTNTVTVTGTYEVGGSLIVTDQASVNIGAPTNLPEGEQPNQQTFIFLPKIDE